jgi:hypothetical protein
MSIVTKGSGRAPRGPPVVGVISKEHIADSVADSIRPPWHRGVRAGVSDPATAPSSRWHRSPFCGTLLSACEHQAAD